MDAVMLAGEDDVPVLQEHHRGRQPEVRVRPLVNLVGERHKDGQCKQVAVPGVDMVNLRCRGGGEAEGPAFNIRLHLAAAFWVLVPDGRRDGRRGSLMRP